MCSYLERGEGQEREKGQERGEGQGARDGRGARMGRDKEEQGRREEIATRRVSTFECQWALSSPLMNNQFICDKNMHRTCPVVPRCVFNVLLRHLLLNVGF